MSEQYPGQVVDVPVIENMIESWKQFQGQTVNGEFELRDYLGGSTHSAVFLTEYDHQIASIHLISENAPDRDRQLASWQLATELSHVNLIRVYQVGICQLANERVFYAVMELPDENLGQILTQRALTAEETTAMLAPALEALAYLHKRDIVHHSINPANIGALGDQLKLSVGTLARAGQANSHPGLYDPPETVSTPAADVWALGLTIVEVLTQRLPSWQRDAQGDPDITATLPQPLFDIARNCLRRDARRRLTVKQIVARLDPSAVSSAAETNEPAASAPAITESKPVPASPSASAPATSASRRAETPAPINTSSHVERPQIRPSYTPSSPQMPPPRREMPELPQPASKNSYRTPVIVVVLLIAAFAGYRFFFSSHSSAPTTAVSSQQESQPDASVAPPSATATPAPPAKPSAAAPNSGSSSDSATAGKPTTQPKAAPKSEASAPAGNASGSVVHEALPEIPERALNTIHGTFHVIVRATSDASGNVSDASIDSPGPSQYFANLALKASRDWKFSPSAPGDWLIRFEFTADGVTASAAPVR